jgi:mannitol/fructose-specific phosphotransferase system IIA component (Ntr-type)
LLWLTGTLADFYRVPYTVQWARGIIGREMLGSTGIGLGVAMPHQYQCKTPAPHVPAHPVAQVVGAE